MDVHLSLDLKGSGGCNLQGIAIRGTASKPHLCEQLSISIGQRSRVGGTVQAAAATDHCRKLVLFTLCHQDDLFRVPLPACNQNHLNSKQHHSCSPGALVITSSSPAHNKEISE